MAQHELLQQIVTVSGLSLGTVCALRRLRAPTVGGYLAVGVIFGPGALALVREGPGIEAMAEIGVLFLLFSTGLKFSLRDLAAMRTWVFVGGGVQVLLCLLALTALGPAVGLGVRGGLVFGCLVALSSTAVTAKVLEERGDLAAPHGRFGMSILLFQDLSVVPMVLLLPLLAGGEGGVLEAGRALLESLGLLAVILVAARFVYPWLMERVVRTRSTEMFSLTTVAVALGTAFAMGAAGLSLELGAFLAGIVVSETDYRHQILDTVGPFRDVFSGLFFVSIGMLVTPVAWFQDPILIFGLALGVLILKGIVIGGLALLFRLGLEAALIVGLGLAQLGEFSFILARQASEAQLLDSEWHQVFLSVTVLTMTTTPLLIALGPVMARRLHGLSLRLPAPAAGEALAGPECPRDHVIIAGYGLQGRNVSRALRQIDVPHTVLEADPLAVRAAQADGAPVVFGDARKERVLRRAGIAEARVLVCSVADPASSRQIVAEARRLNPDLHIAARTRYIRDVEDLCALGADEVLPEEFETAVEMVGLVMETYGATKRAVEREQDSIRQEHYGLLRAEGQSGAAGPTLRGLLEEADVEEVSLGPSPAAAGRSLAELDLRAKTGVTALGIEREGRLIVAPEPSEMLLANAVLLLFGSGESIQAARDLLGADASAVDSRQPPHRARPCARE